MSKECPLFFVNPTPSIHALLQPADRCRRPDPPPASRVQPASQTPDHRDTTTTTGWGYATRQADMDMIDDVTIPDSVPRMPTGLSDYHDWTPDASRPTRGLNAARGKRFGVPRPPSPLLTSSSRKLEGNPTRGSVCLTLGEWLLMLPPSHYMTYVGPRLYARSIGHYVDYVVSI